MSGLLEKFLAVGVPHRKHAENRLRRTCPLSRKKAQVLIVYGLRKGKGGLR